MARELKTTLDLSPVEEDHLTVVGLQDEQQLVTAMSAAGIVTMGPREADDAKREYIVDVEFYPDDLGLENESFDSYLRTFRHAKVTQEAMTTKIHEDLTSALDLDSIFVEVHRMEPTEKVTHIGEP